MLAIKREIELSELAESIANYYCPEGIIEPEKIEMVLYYHIKLINAGKYIENLKSEIYKQ